MEELKPVHRATLGEQVALQLADIISGGRWKPGEKLPSEAELRRAMGVGRSTLREALKSLAFAGMVRMRAGEGTYVADGPYRLVDQILRGGSLKSERDLSEICETRLVLEPALAALCAERATDDDLRKLEEIVSEMQRHCGDANTSRFRELDLAFHMTVAEGCKNQILVRLVRAIRGLLLAWMEKSSESPGSRERAVTHHRRILEALKRRDAAKATSAMRTHLGDIQLVDTLLHIASRAGHGVKPSVRTKRASARGRGAAGEEGSAAEVPG